MEEQKKKKRGRPPGSKNKQRDEVTVHISSCKTCGSTEREKYTNPQVMEQEGFLPNGQQYNQITWRNTRCLRCGQARVDRFFEMVSTVKAEQHQDEEELFSSSDDESNIIDVFEGCNVSNRSEDCLHGDTDTDQREDFEASSDP